MNRLVFIFCIFCFLQGLSAEPKPDFALTNTIGGTDRLALVKTDAKVIVDGIKVLVVPPIESGYTRLTDTKTQIEKVINDFNTKTQNILGAYDSLVAATDGNVQGQFDAFTKTIDEATSYLTSDAPKITTALRGLTYTGISDELTDAFQRIGTGLGRLKSKTIAVQAGIQTAFNSGNSATVSTDALRQSVPLRLMYDMVRSASYLRTYLPLLNYILTKTIEDIKEAESYLKVCEDILQNGLNTEIDKFSDDIKNITGQITKQVADDFAVDKKNAQAAVSGAKALTNIKQATKYGDFMATMTTLDGLFTDSSLSTQTNAMQSAFEKIVTSIKTHISQLRTQFKVLEFPPFTQLIDTLVGNDKYGRYCYHKYKELSLKTFRQGYDSLWRCVEKEYERLEYFKITHELILEQIVYDFEEVLAQTTMCDSISSAVNLNSCIDPLTTFYSKLYEATADKIAVVFQYAIDEAGASENRVLMCFDLVYIENTAVEPEKFSADLQKCSIAGPAGADE